MRTSKAGRDLRKWMNEHKLSYREASNVIGIHLSLLHRLVHGERQFTARSAWLTFKATGIPLETLIGYGSLERR